LPSIFARYFSDWYLSEILVTTARLLQSAPRKFWTSSLDCCYKIFGVRWSTCLTLFLHSFSTTGPAVFRYFSTPSTPSLLDTRSSAHPNAWTKMKWRSILENRVIPEIRCSQHFRHAEPSRRARDGRDEGSKPRKFAAGN